MATRVGTAYVPIDGDWSQFNRKLTTEGKKIDSTFRERGKRAGKLLAAGVALGGGATLVAFGKAAIGASSDVDESLTKNQQLFGRHAKALERWSTSTADNLGVSRREALEATGTFGNLFAALKIGQKPAADMSRDLVKLASDLASFNNADPKEVLESLRSGLAGESEPMRKFGAFLSEGRVKAEAYAKGIAEAGTELTEQQKVQARYSLILKDTGKAQGDFARTSQGVANQQRILRARYEDVKTELGDKLLPVVNRGIGALNKFIGEMKTGTGAGGEFADKMRALANAGEDVGKFLKDHPALIKVAIGAWAAYKVASLAALAKIKVSTFRAAFMRSVPAAAAAGGAAGGAYSTSFTAASTAGLGTAAAGGRFAKAATSIGKFMAPVAAAAFVLEFHDEAEKSFKDTTKKVVKDTKDGKNILGGAIDNFTGDTPADKRVKDEIAKNRRKRLGTIGPGGAGLSKPGSGLGSIPRKPPKTPAIKAPRGGIPGGIRGTAASVRSEARGDVHQTINFNGGDVAQIEARVARATRRAARTALRREIERRGGR